MVRVPEDEVHLRLEPCSAVVTGILGVHRGVPGRLAECPTAAEFQSRPDHALRVSPVELRRPRTTDAWPRQQIKATAYLCPSDLPGLAWCGPTSEPPSLAAPITRHDLAF